MIEKEFTLLFCNNLLNIITNANSLQTAKKNFQQGEKKENKEDEQEINHDRYNCQQSMGLVNWPQNDARSFSAAVFEAFAQTLDHYVHREDVSLKEISSCQTNINTSLIPKWTSNVTPDSPFSQLPALLRDEIKQLSSEQQLEIKKVNPVQPLGLNVNTFFWLSGLALTAGVGFAMLNSSTLHK